MIPKIGSIHLELSSLCNASCPQCSRNNQGGAVNPRLPLVYLTRADIETIFTPSLLAGLEQVKICGNYGDGATAPDAIESFQFLKVAKPGLPIELHSNGGVRETAWWRRLATTVDNCVFGIDGLADMNHLYRRGVSWPKLMQNVQAFIEAGGSAEWHFLIFKHNEHQVEAARECAASLGFKKFVSKRTHRFFKGGAVVSRQPVLSRTGEVEYFLELPDDIDDHNPAMTRLSADIGASSRRPAAAFAGYLEATSIHCKAIERQQIYISSEGLVFPCCWTAGIHGSSRNQVQDLLDRLPGGKESINAKRTAVEEIVRGRFFESVARSWTHSRIADGRLTTCAKHCGNCDLSRAQRASVVGLTARTEAETR